MLCALDRRDTFAFVDSKLALLADLVDDALELGGHFFYVRHVALLFGYLGAIGEVVRAESLQARPQRRAHHIWQRKLSHFKSKIFHLISRRFGHQFVAGPLQQLSASLDHRRCLRYVLEVDRGPIIWYANDLV